MTINHRDENVLRNYLLGKIANETETVRIEERLMSEESFYESLLILEDELNDDYLDQTLMGEDARRFEQYFLASPERLEKLNFTRALRERLSRPKIKPAIITHKRWFGFGSPALSTLFAAAATAIILILIGGWAMQHFLSSKSDADKGLAELRSLYRSERPLQARLTNFDYAPFSVTRGSSPKTTEQIMARDSAARNLLDGAQNAPEAKSLAALGSFYLTEKEFAKAAEQFEAALKIAPNDALIWSDYGATLLESAKTMGADDQANKREGNLTRALEQFDRARALDDSLLAARFNQALAFEQLKLTEKAKEAWRSYLEKDPASPWADEARRNLGQPK